MQGSIKFGKQVNYRGGTKYEEINKKQLSDLSLPKMLTEELNH
jgi:hypothetical protein